MVDTLNDIIAATPQGGRPLGLYRQEVQWAVANQLGDRNTPEGRVRYSSVRLLRMQQVARTWDPVQRWWVYDLPDGENYAYASEVRIETWAAADGAEHDVLVIGSHRDPRVAVIRPADGLVLNIVRADPLFIEHLRRVWGLDGVVLWDPRDPLRIGDQAPGVLRKAA